MKKSLLFLTICLCSQITFSQNQVSGQSELEANKAIARGFYEDLWFSDNTDKYHEYVADTYVVHDIGDRKGVTEPAIEQKNIADFFWKHGELGGAINYQIAEGDLVMTHWTTTFDNPKTIFGRVFLHVEPFNIINVLRIEDGKIVEFWNHRHDIETPQTLKFVFKGLLIGLAFGLIPTVLYFRLKRRMKRES